MNRTTWPTKGCVVSATSSVERSRNARGQLQVPTWAATRLTNSRPTKPRASTRVPRKLVTTTSATQRQMVGRLSREISLNEALSLIPKLGLIYMNNPKRTSRFSHVKKIQKNLVNNPLIVWIALKYRSRWCKGF